jgi:hypothetical protein
MDRLELKGVKSEPSVTIIGAGPAGLTAAYLLCKKGAKVTVLESDPTYVGGISRTARYKGFHFDIGGHRFFSKSKEVEDFWTEILPNDMLERPRSSRIYYRGKFFAYPLQAKEALFKLGSDRGRPLRPLLRQGAALPREEPEELRGLGQQPVRKAPLQHFLQDLHREGLGHELQGDLGRLGRAADQGLSLMSAIWNAFFHKKKPASRDKVIKTLIDSFRYPRKGPGMMWETCAEKVRQMGGDDRDGAPRRELSSRRFERPLDRGPRGRSGPAPPDGLPARHFIDADAAPFGRDHAKARREHAPGRQRAALSRLSHGHADPQRPESLRRQLDLYP